MTEEDSIGTTVTSVPEAIVQRKRLISMVWLVPIIAALIGSWLAIRALSQMGPTITIYFDDAEGLVAGKTRIMYKNVELGKVDTIRLSEDLSRVEVTAKLSKETENFLSTSTRFWVVRARVAAGLGLLFSILAMITGSIFAKVTWRSFWNWDCGSADT